MDRGFIPTGTIGTIINPRKRDRGYTVEVKFEHNNEALWRLQQEQRIVAQHNPWELTKEEYGKYLKELS